MAVIAVGGIALSGGTVASARGSVCSIPNPTGQERCYLPSQVARADQLFPHSVDPSQAVYRATQLGLARVVVTGNPPAKHQAFQPIAIQYIYGTMNSRSIRPIGSPKFVVVWEYPGKAPRFVQKYYRNGLEITPAIRQNRQPAFGPWFVRANFPHRNLYLVIAANYNQGILTGLANAILRAG
jgi:hypothetical protein